MLGEKTLALLGDREAQEAFTARGELLPCPKCGGEVAEYGPEDWKPTWYDPDSGGDPVNYVCECGLTFCIGSYDYHETMKEWNTRPPLLTPTQMALLGIARKPRKFEVDICAESNKKN